MVGRMIDVVVLGQLLGTKQDATEEAMNTE
jgi:hypothetical protein